VDGFYFVVLLLFLVVGFFVESSSSADWFVAVVSGLKNRLYHLVDGTACSISKQFTGHTQAGSNHEIQGLPLATTIPY